MSNNAFDDFFVNISEGFQDTVQSGIGGIAENFGLLNPSAQPNKTEPAKNVGTIGPRQVPGKEGLKNNPFGQFFSMEKSMPWLIIIGALVLGLFLRRK